MIHIYKNQQDIPADMKIVRINDIYFNRHTAHLLDEKAEEIIARIDGAHLKGKYQIISNLTREIINIDKLSSGCKTALNLIYNSDKVFSIIECGDNALSVIYRENTGNVYSEYPIISMDMTSVQVHDKNGERIINSYEELKEWWEDVQ